MAVLVPSDWFVSALTARLAEAVLLLDSVDVVETRMATPNRIGR